MPSCDVGVNFSQFAQVLFAPAVPEMIEDIVQVFESTSGLVGV